MYLVGDSFHVSFEWVLIISTKQEAAHTQSAKVSTCYTLWHFGDWSLITGTGGGGGDKMAGWGQVFTPTKEGGAEKSLSRAEGEGGTKSFKVVLTWVVEVLAMVMGGAQKVSTL